MCIFAGAWMVFAPHPWALWSILGSALILFTSYFQVQVSVAINSWINGVSVDEYVFPYWPSCPPRIYRRARPAASIAFCKPWERSVNAEESV